MAPQFIISKYASLSLFFLSTLLFLHPWQKLIYTIWIALSHTHRLHRRLDPIFAISIGLAAAVTRINREEKEKGRSTQESWDVLKRRWALAWESGGTAAVSQEKKM
jgi:hypothetical protein